MARMGNESLPKQVMLGNWRGECYLGGHEKNCMDCLERDLWFFNLHIEEKQWALAANQSRELFSRVEEAREQYMKCWFVKNNYKVNYRRGVEVQNAQQLQTSLGSRTVWRGAYGEGGGGAALKERNNGG